MSHRVVITGLGPVTPIGIGAQAFHEGQLAGRNGVRNIERFDTSKLACRFAGQLEVVPEDYGLDKRVIFTGFCHRRFGWWCGRDGSRRLFDREIWQKTHD